MIFLRARVLLSFWCVLALTGFCLQEVSAQISILSPLSDDRQAYAGDAYDGSILIRNDTNDPQEVKLYQTDYQFFADGTNRFETPGSHDRSNADWIRISDSRLLLPPNRTVSLFYVVDVPSQSELPACGVYWSALFVEAIPAGSPESLLLDDLSRARLTTQTALRYGIQLATHVPGSLCGTDLRFQSVRCGETDAGIRVLEIDVANVGEMLARPDVWIELYPADSTESFRLDGPARRLYPGTSVRQRFEVDGLAAGDYTLLIVADAGGEDLFGSQIQVSL